MRITAIINQKGGIGKTATALALGTGLSKRGYKTLIIDTDAQGNTSRTFKAKAGFTVMELLTQTATAAEAIQSTESGADLIPYSPALAAADTVLTATGKEYRLKEALQPIKDNYDYIIIDTPPGLGTLTINALTAADDIIIPAQAAGYSLEAIGNLYGTIKTVRQYTNAELKISGILVTMYDKRKRVQQQAAALLEETAVKLGSEAYKSRIRVCAAVEEAAFLQLSIFDYKLSNATADYNAFIDEYLERCKK